ncbi:MAG TPA: type II toxin-antitoxin system RelE/ParE family toxin [Acidimicrobiales bacterium]|jgi:mRNA interferase RelE/StbE|nr:type II toxin-antitoxin system RelE/ParE family toxin [Acidimicrobiales bacterium]
MVRDAQPFPNPESSSRQCLIADLLLRVSDTDYRIIYTIDDGVLLIVVVTIGHRRDVYQ